MESLKQKLIDYVDAVVYINLAKRTDRNEKMQEFVKGFGSKAQRFEAIEHTNGAIGCSKSHIGVMELALASNWKNVLVLEDDVAWNDTEEGYTVLDTLLSSPFDVILLGGSYSVVDTRTFRLHRSWGSHAYIVNSHYFSTLYSNLKEGCGLLQVTSNRSEHSLDNYWRYLMKRDNWYCVIPNIIYQYDGYSNVLETPRRFSIYQYITRTIRIKRAIWGYDRDNVDVTDIVKGWNFPTNTKQKLTLSLLNNVDPCKGKRKVLMIEFMDGKIQLIIEHDEFCLH